MANTVAYQTPAVATPGSTPPTAAQSAKHNQIAALVTGDGAATSVTITHNWGLSAGQLANLYPLVSFEALLASGNTAAPIVTTRAANSITLTVTAFSGAGLLVRLQRPFSMIT